MSNDMDLRTDTIRIISTCTGLGGLDRAVELAIPGTSAVAVVEGESFAVANLVAQMQKGIMAPAPIHGDLRTFPGRKFRGCVDGVIGGISCQPHSVAGKRLEHEDARDLWAPFRRVFVQSGAWFFIIENVGGMLTSGGAERIWRDVYRMGGKIEAVLVTASECGLNHGRERIFLLAVFEERFLAHAGHAGHAGQQGRGSHGYRQGKREAAERGGGPLEGADVGRCGRETDQGQPSGELDGSGRDVANADSPGSPAQSRDVGEVGGVQEAQRGAEHGSAVSRRGGREVVHTLGARRSAAGSGPEIDAGSELEPGEFGLGDAIGSGKVVLSETGSPRNAVGESGRSMGNTIGGGRDGRPQDPLGTPQEREALEWASGGYLFAPGPSDVAAWSWVAEWASDRLPALSLHDRFRSEIRKAALAAYGLATEGSCKAWGNSPPASWVDENGPYGLCAAIVREIAQFHLRERSDGLATRIDELRAIGNGCSDLQGAFGVRLATTRLARRSAAAGFLARRLVQ